MRSHPPRTGRAAWIALALVCTAGPAPAVDPGGEAPSFQAPRLDADGSVSLAAYRGRVVYLDFWATWCPPCRLSLPALEGLRQEFPAEDFAVVAVNLDRDLEDARRFLRRRPVGYPSASDPEGLLPERFGVETMPTAFLIDREGVVRHVHRGFRRGDVDELREHIRSLVAAGR